MVRRLIQRSFAPGLIGILVLSGLMIGPTVFGNDAHAEKTKVLYHVDGPDPKVAKYAMALINKHIEAE